MSIRFTVRARTEFLEILSFISRDDRLAAVRLRSRVEDALERLEQFPESGRTIPEFRSSPTAE